MVMLHDPLQPFPDLVQPADLLVDPVNFSFDEPQASLRFQYALFKKDKHPQCLLQRKTIVLDLPDYLEPPQHPLGIIFEPARITVVIR